MSNLGPLVGWGVVIALSLVAGAVAAAVLRLSARVAAVVTSFGGGVLLAAVALELVLDADERAGPWLTAVGLLAGTLIYVGADTWLSRNEQMKAVRRFDQPRPRVARWLCPPEPARRRAARRSPPGSSLTASPSRPRSA